MIFWSAQIKAQELDSLRLEVKSLRQQVSRIDELERKLAKVADDSSYIKFQNARASAADTTRPKILEIPREDMKESNKGLTGKDLIADDFF